MGQYYGENTYQLDAKCRMRMPAKFRLEMGSECLIAKGTGGCLFVFDSQAMDKLHAKIDAIPISDIDAGNALRRFTASAVKVEFDEQGRFTLPAHLKQYARIEKNVSIIGAGSKVEIWAQEIWNQQYANDQIESYESAFSSLTKYGV